MSETAFKGRERASISPTALNSRGSPANNSAGDISNVSKSSSKISKCSRLPHLYRNYTITASPIMENVKNLKKILPTGRMTEAKFAVLTVPSVYAVYPPIVHERKPQPPLKANPLNPHQNRRGVFTETVDSHFHNEERTWLMKRQEYNRFHEAWARYYYGDHIDKELYG